MDRLHELGGAIILEEFPGPMSNDTRVPDPADKAQAHGEREIAPATRQLLVERANRLAEAMERLRTGKYGICEECREPIATARLNARPEVTTCVRCQDGLERKAKQAAEADVAALKVMRKRNRRGLQKAGGLTFFR